MDPRGQVQDLESLRRQGYNVEASMLSPEICAEVVNALNAPKGKGISFKFKEHLKIIYYFNLKKKNRG